MTSTDPKRAPTEKTFVADLLEGEAVRTYFLCSQKEARTAATGTPFLKLTLRDRSGEVPAIHFDPADDILRALTAGDVVKVEGTYSVHERWGPQLKVERLRRLSEGEYDAAALIAVSPVPVAELEARLTSLVDSVTDQGLHYLLVVAFDRTREPGATFFTVPAAKANHHAYRHGLLEHSVVVAETALRVADGFALVDRDLLVAGALLHDIGKVRSYSNDPMTPGFTDEGLLLGEIVVGLEIVGGLIDQVPDLSPAHGQRLLHIIAAHHGEREKGSPVVPQIREAVVIHYCDDMTARLAAIDEATRKAPEGSVWTQRIGMLGVPAYLGGDSVAAPRDDQSPAVEPADDEASDDDVITGEGETPDDESDDGARLFGD